jgi:hypothetical protein
MKRMTVWYLDSQLLTLVPAAGNMRDASCAYGWRSRQQDKVCVVVPTRSHLLGSLRSLEVHCRPEGHADQPDDEDDAENELETNGAER